jgi:hypothetical protein
VFVPGINILGQGVTKTIIGLRMPKTRPMDNVELHPDFPQEEEFAIANTSPYSVYHALAFPSKMEKYFCRYVLMKLASPERWRKSYHSFIQKMQYKAGEKTLLLKNPANTGRVRELVDMYPDARFIYIQRNPDEVKISTYRMLSALIEANTLQRLDDQKLRDAVEVFHSRLLSSYEAQKNLIPDGNLVEVTYEDFVTSPVEVVRKIYDDLALSNFNESFKRFEAFAKEQEKFVPQRYARETVTL